MVAAFWWRCRWRTSKSVTTGILEPVEVSQVINVNFDARRAKPERAERTESSRPNGDVNKATCAWVVSV